MYRLVVTLHVLFAVLLTGPAAFVPFMAVTGLVARDPERIRRAGKRTFQFGLLTLLIAGSGLLALGRSDTYRFGTPWVTIAATVYVIAVLLDVLVLPGVLSRAAKHVEEATAASPEVPDTPNDPERVAVASALVDQQRGRLLALAGLTVALYAVAAVMMAFKPFGN